MKYDIMIIGAGSGGLNIAGFMNKAGFKVLLIDKSDAQIGGDCLNYGCVPSKALIHAARLVKNADKATVFGLKKEGRVDLKKVMDYVRFKQDIIRKHENAAYFRSIGMDVVLGNAQFTGRNAVDVDGTKYSAKRIVIATGSKSRRLRTQGIDDISYITNETIFELEKLPKHLLVIGGGPIGIELGQAFLYLGSEVTVIQSGPMFLPKEDPEIAKVLYKQLIKDGMEIYFNSKPKKFDGNTATISIGTSKETTLRFDKVLISIGRELDFTGMNLEKAGIKTDSGRLVVDDYLRTTNKRVYVCGDAAGSYQFTHAAELHAGIIIRNFFSPKKRKVNYDNLSWVTYTNPEIATFGLNEKQLNKKETKYEKLSIDFSDDDRAIVDDYREGKLTLLVNKNRLLGGSMAAINAGELFQELVLANKTKMDIKHIFEKIYPYPTATRINKQLISKYFSKKLTDRSKKILRWLY